MKLTLNIEKNVTSYLIKLLSICISGFSTLAIQNKSFGDLLKNTHGYIPPTNHNP